MMFFNPVVPSVPEISQSFTAFIQKLNELLICEMQNMSKSSHFRHIFEIFWYKDTVTNKYGGQELNYERPRAYEDTLFRLNEFYYSKPYAGFGPGTFAGDNGIMLDELFHAFPRLEVEWRTYQQLKNPELQQEIKMERVGPLSERTSKWIKALYAEITSMQVLAMNDIDRLACDRLRANLWELERSLVEEHYEREGQTVYPEPGRIIISNNVEPEWTEEQKAAYFGRDT